MLIIFIQALNVPILHNQSLLRLNSQENIGDVYKIPDLDQLQVSLYFDIVDLL